MTEAGTYEVTLTVTDNQGATDTRPSRSRSPTPVDPPPNADPVAHITGTTCTVPELSAERERLDRRRHDRRL